MTNFDVLNGIENIKVFPNLNEKKVKGIENGKPYIFLRYIFLATLTECSEFAE